MCFRRWAAILVWVGGSLAVKADDLQHKLSSSVVPCAFEEYAVRNGSSVAVVYPSPEGIEESSLYKLSVMGHDVFCYADRRFDPAAEKDEFGMTTSPQAFAVFDFSGSVELKIEVLDSGLLKRTREFFAAPRSCGLSVRQRGKFLMVRLSRPGNYIIDPDGSGRNALHLFTALPEETIPDRKDPNVIFFGPGVHDIEKQIVLKDGQTLYVAGGAVLRPFPDVPRNRVEKHYTGTTYEFMKYPIVAADSKDITICGRGVISAERALPARKRFGLIALSHCRNAVVRDVTLVDSPGWTFYFWDCDGCLADNVRVLGWFTNSDGLLVNSSHNITVQNCFIHNADDGFEIKTDNDGRDVKDVVFKNCLAWTDVGTSMGIVHEISAPVSDVEFRDMTVLHYNYKSWADFEVPHRGAIYVHPAFGGTVSNLTFRNITIESYDSVFPAVFVYNGKYYQNSSASFGEKYPYARIENVLFKNIRVLSGNGGFSEAVVYDHSPSGDYFKNIVFEDAAYRNASGQWHPLELKVTGNPDVKMFHGDE